MSYPAPILNLNFANAKQLVHPAVSFSRASQGSYFDGNGIIRYANNSVPRFDHDPLTGICKGLLVEPAVTFLGTYSEQFDNAAWTKNRATITPNAAVAPDGTNTMDKLVEDTTNGGHYVSTGAKSFATGAITASVFVKAGERSKLNINMSDYVSAVAVCSFDVALGTATVVSEPTPWSAVVPSIKHVGGGIYRCSMTAIKGQGTSVGYEIFLDNGSGASYTGDGTSGLYIWGAQLEAGAFPTSYLPTTTAGVTRAADVCTVDLTKLTRNGSPLWTGTGGTIVVNGRTAASKPSGSSVQVLAQIDDGTANNRVRIYRNSTGNIRCSVDTSGVTQADIDLGVVADSTEFKVSFSFASNAFYASLNGGASVSDTSGTMPTGLVTRRYGCDSAGSQQWGGHLKLDQMYNRPLKAYVSTLSAL